MNPASPAYAFATALFKAEEAKALTLAMVKDALTKTTIDEAVASMKASSLGQHLEKNPVSSFDEADTCLQTYIDACLNRMLSARTPSVMTRIATAYLNKFDILNIKIALRRLVATRDAPFISAGTIHGNGLLSELSAVSTVQDMAKLMERCALGAYAPIVEDIEPLDMTSVVKAEIALEKTYYAQMYKTLLSAGDSRVTKKALGVMIDMINLRILLRSALAETAVHQAVYMNGGAMLSAEKLSLMAAMKLPELAVSLEHTRYSPMVREIIRKYETSGDIRVVEQLGDIHQIMLLKELLAPMVFSPAMVLAFIVVKEWETRIARLVLKAVSERLPSSMIMDYIEA